MNPSLIDAIVNAVLYEGYMLYPYRPSAVKNRQRFNFGVVYPRSYSEVQGGTDAWTMQTECLVQGSGETQCRVRVKFLRMVARSVETVLAPTTELNGATKEDIKKVERLEIDGKNYQAWQEAVEEVVEVTEFRLADLATKCMLWPFQLFPQQERELLRDERGLVAGSILRDRANLFGILEIGSEHLKPGIFKLTTRILNVSPTESGQPVTREDALARSLVSAHTILELRDGEFISLVDPPATFRDLAQACQNVGTWPILVGERGQRDTMLSSPIILYDYPEIAPESPGDLYDGAEIDEILSLRIMTLTEEEKAEMRQSDERARRILERTESMPQEQWMKLHGAFRGLRAVGKDMP